MSKQTMPPRPELKLLKVVKAPSPKKWTAVFQRGKRTLKRHFGAEGYEDYTMHKNRDRRYQYLFRHKKDLRTNDPTRAGFLSLFLLWGESTSLRQQIRWYREQLKVYNRTGRFPTSWVAETLKKGLRRKEKKRKLGGGGNRLLEERREINAFIHGGSSA